MKKDTLMEFSVMPLGAGESISTPIAKVVSKVRDSGLPHQVQPMGTVVESELDACLDLIRASAHEVLQHAPRTMINIRLDIRPGHEGRIQHNVDVVQAKV